MTAHTYLVLTSLVGQAGVRTKFVPRLEVSWKPACYPSYALSRFSLWFLCHWWSTLRPVRALRLFQSRAQLELIQLKPSKHFSSDIFIANGAAVTLFYVSAPTPTTSTPADQTVSVEESATRTASAIGPGDSGMTRYEVQVIQSKLALHFQDTTITYISEPTTRTCERLFDLKRQ